MINRPLQESIAHLNVGGLKNKLRALELYLLENSISWCFLSETWLSPAEDSPSNNLIMNLPFLARSQPTGHYPYGIGLLINPTLCSPADFKVLKNDSRSQQLLFEYRGVCFACVYIPPNSTASAVQDRLSFMFRLLDDAPLFLIGDLNGRLREFGDHYSNAQGNHLQETIDIACLTHIPSVKGLWTFRREDQHSIPDHTFANDLALLLDPILVIDEFYDLCDHRPSLLTFTPLSGPKSSKVSSQTTGHWNRWKLNDPIYKHLLIQEMSLSYSATLDNVNLILNNPMLEDQEKADLSMQEVTNWTNRCLASRIGRAGPSNRNVNRLTSPDVLFTQMWISSLQQRISKSSEPVRSVLLQTLEQAEAQLQAQQRVAHQSDAPDKAWNSLDNNSQQKLFKSLIQRRSATALISLPNDAASLNEYRSYYAGRFQGSYPLQTGEEWIYDDEVDLEETVAFSVEQIDSLLEKLPNGKASGQNGIPCEVLRLGHRFFAVLLQPVFTFCLLTGVVPHEWRSALISPIAKKVKVDSIEDTRPISLTDVFRKVFEKLLLPTLTDFAEPLHIAQGGFRDRRGCLDQVTYLNEFIAQSENLDLDVFITFLDIKAAYDTVHRPLLWHKCRKKGFPEYLIRVLQALFDNTTARIGIRGVNSESFSLSSGLLQGSILSPLLYSIFIDDLATMLQDVGINAESCGLSLSYLLYADDIVLFCNDRATHQRLLATCHDHSLLNGYSFNIQKCCTLSTKAEYFYLNHEVIPCSESFNYLGFIFSLSGIDWPAHAARLTAKAEKCVSQLKSLGLCSPTLSPSSITSAFKTFVRPIFEYGLALAPRRYEWMIQKGLNSALRLLFSLPSRCCLQALCLYVGIEPTAYRLHRLAIRWASQTADKDGAFAIEEAKEISTSSYCPPPSVFRHLGDNPLIQATDLSPATFRSYLTSCWMAQIDQRKAFGLLRAFGLMRRSELTRMLKKMRRSSQHALIRWAIGSDFGPWRDCPNCRQATSERPHVEACVFGLSGTYDTQFDSCLFTLLNRNRTFSNLELIGLATQLIRSL